MTALDERLIPCFQAVLPGLRPDQIMRATQDSVESWDSIAMATLLTVIGEEFGVVVDYDSVDQLTSYASLREYVAGLAGAGR
jgi:acyl carrier protein